MRPSAAAAPIVALTLLAGCRFGSLESGPPPPSAKDCGAAMIADRWLGRVANPEVKAYIAARVSQRLVRYYTIGDPITMDYNPARLNVEIGKDGLIKRFRCG